MAGESKVSCKSTSDVDEYSEHCGVGVGLCSYQSVIIGWPVSSDSLPLLEDADVPRLHTGHGGQLVLSGSAACMATDCCFNSLTPLLATLIRAASP